MWLQLFTPDSFIKCIFEEKKLQLSINEWKTHFVLIVPEDHENTSALHHVLVEDCQRNKVFIHSLGTV